MYTIDYSRWRFDVMRLIWSEEGLHSHHLIPSKDNPEQRHVSLDSKFEQLRGNTPHGSIFIGSRIEEGLLHTIDTGNETISCGYSPPEALRSSLASVSHLKHDKDISMIRNRRVWLENENSSCLPTFSLKLLTPVSCVDPAALAFYRFYISLNYFSISQEFARKREANLNFSHSRQAADALF